MNLVKLITKALSQHSLAFRQVLVVWDGDHKATALFQCVRNILDHGARSTLGIECVMDGELTAHNVELLHVVKHVTAGSGKRVEDNGVPTQKVLLLDPGTRTIHRLFAISIPK